MVIFGTWAGGMTDSVVTARIPGGSGRLHYLDNLRIVALLLGLFVHCDDFVSAADQLSSVEAFSGNFRMATFFLVSGFFAALVLAKGSRGGFYRQRLLAVGVPLVFGVVALNGITNSLKIEYRAYFILQENADIGAPGTPTLIHLWFLACLFIYVLLAPALARVFGSAQVKKVVEAVSTPRLAGISSFAVTLAVIGYILSVRFVGSQLDFPFVVRSLFIYLPFFALGCLLFVQQASSAIFYRIDLPAFGLAIGLAVLARVLPADSLLQTIARFGSVAAFQCCITFAALWLFRRYFDVATPLTRVLSRSMYTVYVLHYLLLALAASVWIILFPPGLTQALISAAAIFLAGVAVHFAIVERFALARFLLNGKLPERGGRSSAVRV